MGYWLGFRLVNIQSWVDLRINLTKGLNIFEARSETGKSVLFKVLRQACFPHFFGKSGKKTIIRRRCSHGEAYIYLEKYTVKFEFYRTYSVYRLLTPEETQIQSWQQEQIPDKLLKILGISKDDESTIILNLIDQELGLTFDSTTPQFNGRALKFVIESDDLNNSRNNITLWLKDLERAKNREESNIETLNQLMSVYKYRDIEEFQINLRNKKQLLPIINFFVDMYEGVESLRESTTTGFKYANKDKMNSLIENLDVLEYIKRNIDESSIKTLEKFNSVDKLKITHILREEESFKVLETSILQLEELKAQDKKFNKIEHSKMENILTTCSDIEDLKVSIDDLCNIIENKKNFNYSNIKNIENMMKIQNELLSMKYIVAELTKSVIDINSYEYTLKTIKDEKQKFEQEYKFCPLCGQEFSKEENHEGHKDSSYNTRTPYMG